MASTDNEVPAPIIVKKIKKGGGGHHGGAWKVAYADFVTAMMAFFLLMWLLNVTTKEEKNAISNFFDPTHPRVSNEQSGSGGILGGLTMSPDGAQTSTVQEVTTPPTPTTPQSGMAKGDQRDQLGTSDYEGDEYDAEMQGVIPSDTDKGSTEAEDGNDLKDGLNIFEEVQNIDEAELEKLQAIVEAQQNENFEEIKQKILEEVEKAPELADLLDHLMIDITPEGLRIQIIDKDGRSMFPIGSPDMFDFMRQLVAKVTQVIIPQSNQISIRGHTDGKPYPPDATYNNWNLSSDRALASRNAMITSGLPTERIDNIIGKADREHLLPDDPLSERNRRISIVLLRQPLENAEDIRKAAADAIKKRSEKIEAQKQSQPKTGEDQPSAGNNGEPVEDRENVPELDRVIDQTPDGQASVKDSNAGRSVPRGSIQQPGLENKQGSSSDSAVHTDENTSDPEADIGDEIQKIRERNAAKGQKQEPAPRPLPAPNGSNTSEENDRSPEPQVLEFP